MSENNKRVDLNDEDLAKVAGGSSGDSYVDEYGGYYKGNSHTINYLDVDGYRMAIIDNIIFNKYTNEEKFCIHLVSHSDNQNFNYQSYPRWRLWEVQSFWNQSEMNVYKK